MKMDKNRRNCGGPVFDCCFRRFHFIIEAEIWDPMSTLTPTPTPKLPAQRRSQAGVTISGGGRERGAAVLRPGVFHHHGGGDYDRVPAGPAVNAFLKLRMPRAVASFIVCSIALLVLYLLGLGSTRSSPGSWKNYRLSASG
jgi:hypothetical protein